MIRRIVLRALRPVGYTVARTEELEAERRVRIRLEEAGSNLRREIAKVRKQAFLQDTTMTREMAQMRAQVDMLDARLASQIVRLRARDEENARLREELSHATEALRVLRMRMRLSERYREPAGSPARASSSEKGSGRREDASNVDHRGLSGSRGYELREVEALSYATTEGRMEPGYPDDRGDTTVERRFAEVVADHEETLVELARVYRQLDRLQREIGRPEPKKAMS